MMGFNWKKQLLNFLFRNKRIYFYISDQQIEISDKQSLQIMKAVKTIHSAFTSMDLFSSQQFLRYKGQAEYKTATGGFCSLMIIAIFIVLFINSGLNVLNKSTVIVSSDIQHQTDPPLTVLVASPAGGFMFAVNLIQTNIFDSNYTYFNASIQQNSRNNQRGIRNTTKIPLEPCTEAHLDFDSDMRSQYHKFNLGVWLCPPLNYEFSVGGNYLSEIYQYFSIFIKKCDASIYSNCAPDSKLLSIMNTAGAFRAVLATFATSINPSQTSKYLGNFIQTRNIFTFTNTIAVLGVGEVMDYQIETDTSLLPMESIKIQSGAYIPSLLRQSTIPVFNDTYVQIKFQKSPETITYNRSFQKVDDFLSYVGGLVGLVFTMIFILNSYSEASFQISIGSRLFTYFHDVPIDSGSFNFLTYLSFIAFKICRFFGCCKRFQMMEAYNCCREEVEKQIDILNILQRISTLQRGIISILTPTDFELLHFREKPTIQEAKSLRQKSQLYRKYRKKDTAMYEDRSPRVQMGVFTQQSSVSSMSTRKYSSFKNRLFRFANKQAESKCLNEKFLYNFSKGIVKTQRQDAKQAAKPQQELGKLIGDDYFRQLSNPHLRGAQNGWTNNLKSNERDQL